MKTIAIFQRHGSQWNPDLPVRKEADWKEHALFEAGTVILAGPFADGSGSMVIVKAESIEAAPAIFREDRGRSRTFWSPARSRSGQSSSTRDE
jgi:hypothetical protein